MLPPSLARWITDTFAGVDAYSALWLGLVSAKDPSDLPGGEGSRRRRPHEGR